MRLNLIRYLSKLNPELIQSLLDSQLARRAANPRRAFVVDPLVSLPARCSRKRTLSGRCRRRATGRWVCSRSRPGCCRSAPRLRRPSTTLSLLQSPNWRLSEPHLASGSTRAREQRFFGPTLLIAGSRSVPAVASEPNNYRRLATATPRTLFREHCAWTLTRGAACVCAGRQALRSKYSSTTAGG